MTEEEYIQVADEYLNSVKLTSLEIRSLKNDIQHIRSNLCTLRAVDYSNERLSGGGTPTGLEVGVSALVDAEQNANNKMGELVKQCEQARALISEVENVKSRIILNELYVNGKTDRWVRSFVGYSKPQYSRYKRIGKIEIGQKMRPKET